MYLSTELHSDGTSRQQNTALVKRGYKNLRFQNDDMPKKKRKDAMVSTAVIMHLMTIY